MKYIFEDMPGHLVRRFQQLATATFKAQVEAAGFDLTSVQYAALATVGELAEIDQATLASIIVYDKATITGVVDRLVRKGLMVRTVDEKDRRARLLTITPQGMAILRDIRPSVEAAQVMMTRALENSEKTELLRLMKKSLRIIE